MLLGDKAYDTDAIVARAERQGTTPVIPPPRALGGGFESMIAIGIGCGTW